MSNSIHNVVRAAKNTINSLTSTVDVGCQLVADGTGLVNKGISAAPRCGLQVLLIPFSLAKGMLIQNGVSEEEADSRAYKYVRQDLSRTIEEVSVGTGKALAELLKDDLSNDANGSSKLGNIEEITIEAPVQQ